MQAHNTSTNGDTAAGEALGQGEQQADQYWNVYCRRRFICDLGTGTTQPPAPCVYFGACLPLLRLCSSPRLYVAKSVLCKRQSVMLLCSADQGYCITVVLSALQVTCMLTSILTLGRAVTYIRWWAGIFAGLSKSLSCSALPKAWGMGYPNPFGAVTIPIQLSSAMPGTCPPPALLGVRAHVL